MEVRSCADVDPVDVLRLNLTSLAFPLTPGLAGALREHDRRYLPEFALYAVVEGQVAAQVGLLVADVETVRGSMRFGAVWAVAGPAAPAKPAQRRRRAPRRQRSRRWAAGEPRGACEAGAAPEHPIAGFCTTAQMEPCKNGFSEKLYTPWG